MILNKQASLLLLVVTAAQAAERTWTLFHAVGQPGKSPTTFTERGQLKLTLKGEKDSKDKKPALVSKDKDSPYQLELTHSETAVADWIQQLLQPGAFYQLKLVPSDSKKPSIVTSVPACDVRRANFRDELVVYLGAQAQAISLSYTPLVSPLAPESCDLYQQEEGSDTASFSFSSRLYTETAVPAMTLKTVLPDYMPPPGWNILPGAQEHARNFVKEQEKEKQEQDNSFPFGFMKRYWYILLPLFLMNFIGVDPPPEEQQAAAAAGGAAAASSAAAAAPRRRGKRD